MKKILTFFSIIIILSSQVIGQIGWYEVNSGVTSQMHSTYFTNYNNGYAVGRNGTILKTTDGGSIWNTQTSPTSTHLLSVYFTNANTGYTVSGNSILKSSNAGVTWALQNTTQAGFAVYFPSPLVGYVVGDFGSVVKTITASVTWVDLTSTTGTTEDLYGVYFIDDNVGYAVGKNGAIIKTTNGGQTWSTLTSGTTYNLMDVQFTNSNTGYAIGADVTSGVILKTTNAGVTWNTIDSIGYQIEGLHFPTADTGYVVGFDPNTNKGLILKTTDAGNTWVKQFSPTNQTLNEVFFVDGYYGFAVGVHGTIIKTTNGGVGGGSGINEVNNTTSNFRNYPNPFNENTTFEFVLPEKTEISIKIIDLTGREIAIVIKETKQAGKHRIRWNKTNANGIKLNNGVYYAILQYEDKIISRPLLAL
ncbi:YCF48-related protein [candidate division KSB1 bacterium]